MVFHGDDGLDELTTTTTSTVHELVGTAVRTYRIDPTEFGIDFADAGALMGGDAAANADHVRSVLAGDKGAHRDIAVLNTGAALVVAGIAADIEGGVEAARAAIDDGKAAAALGGAGRDQHEGQSVGDRGRGFLMAPVLQCPDCSTKHPLDVASSASAFRCEGCGRTLKVPAQFRRRGHAAPRPPRDRRGTNGSAQHSDATVGAGASWCGAILDSAGTVVCRGPAGLCHRVRFRSRVRDAVFATASGRVPRRGLGPLLARRPLAALRRAGDRLDRALLRALHLTLARPARNPAARRPEGRLTGARAGRGRRRGVRRSRRAAAGERGRARGAVGCRPAGPCARVRARCGPRACRTRAAVVAALRRRPRAQCVRPHEGGAAGAGALGGSARGTERPERVVVADAQGVDDGQARDAEIRVPPPRAASGG